MLAAVIVTVGYTNLKAQKGVSSTVAANFSREFKDASNVRWTKIKQVSLARFDHQGEFCLAYFDAEGQLILNGRKISEDNLPLAVKKETARIRKAAEKSQDILAIAEVYELSDPNGTRYFINLSSESLSMSIMAYGNGQSEILSRVNNKHMETANPVVTSKATR